MLTEYSPAAAPLMETETPFNSIGRIGLRSVSGPPTAFFSDGANVPVDRIMLNSTGARPAGTLPGSGVGVGEGDGDGFALAGTSQLLGQVKYLSASAVSDVTAGL